MSNPAYSLRGQRAVLIRHGKVAEAEVVKRNMVALKLERLAREAAQHQPPLTAEQVTCIIQALCGSPPAA